MAALLKKTCFLTLFLALGSFPTFSQEIDLMLKGGTVIDPKNKINLRLDVAIDDGIIIQVGPNLSTKNVFQVVDVSPT